MAYTIRGFIVCFLLMCDIYVLYANSKDENDISEEALFELQQKIQTLQTQIIQEKQNREDLNNNDDLFATYSSKVVDNDKDNPTNPLDLFLDTKDSTDMIKNISSDSSIINFEDQRLAGIFNTGGGIDVGGAPPITNRGELSFIGAYSGNNSVPIGMIPSNLFASTVIGQRDKFEDYSIFLGGFIGIDAQTWFGNQYNRVDFENNPTTPSNANGQNIYLTSARLYFLANVGDYVTASYDVSTDQSEEFLINSAFAIFGNMTVSPFFVTAGKSPLTLSSYGGGGTYVGSIAQFLDTGRPTNISINYKTETINASVAVFGSNDQKANFSMGLFYGSPLTENITIGFNTGYIYNVEGSENFFIELAAPGEKIGVYNIDTNIAYDLGGSVIQFNGGWGTTTNKSDFNGSIEKEVLAGAWYIAGNYSLELAGRNTNFNIAYGKSYNASTIPALMPASPFQEGLSESGIEHQFVVSAQRAYFDDDVLFGPEWAFQKLYDGKNVNTITMDISIYV